MFPFFLNHRDKSIHKERERERERESAVNINRFMFTAGLTSADHAIYMCILRSLWLKSTLVELETRCTVILPPTVSVLWCGRDGEIVVSELVFFLAF